MLYMHNNLIFSIINFKYKIFERFSILYNHRSISRKLIELINRIYNRVGILHIIGDKLLWKLKQLPIAQSLNSFGKYITLHTESWLNLQDNTPFQLEYQINNKIYAIQNIKSHTLQNNTFKN